MKPRIILAAAFTLAAQAASPLVDPASVGMDAEKLKDVRPAMQKFVDEGALSGAVTLVAREGQVVSHEAVGFADLEKKTPMRKDSLFWIASMTKPVTAMAVMMLADEGRLSIDDPVAKHLPEFRGQMLLAERTAERAVLVKPKRPPAIKDLLTHTSGLVGQSPLDGEAIDKLTLKEAVITYALSPLQFEPGSKWSYCNPGINTLGRIVEVASGQPFAEFMEQRIFSPLGMRDTTFWPSEQQLKRLAVSYKPAASGKGLEPAGITYLTRPYSNQKRMPLAAGGLFSTAGDLFKLHTMWLGGGESGGRRFISKEALSQMTAIHSGDLKAGFTEGMGMGLGFQVVRDPVGVTAMLSPGAYGHGGAHGTQGWIDPKTRTIYIMLIQRAGLKNGDASPMREAFQKAAAAAIR